MLCLVADDVSKRCLHDFTREAGNVALAKLTAAAKEALDHYVRHGELVVTSRATFDSSSLKAIVQQFGKRLIFPQFKPYFEDDKNKVLIDPLAKTVQGSNGWTN